MSTTATNATALLEAACHASVISSHEVAALRRIIDEEAYASVPGARADRDSRDPYEDAPADCPSERARALSSSRWEEAAGRLVDAPAYASVVAAYGRDSVLARIDGWYEGPEAAEEGLRRKTEAARLRREGEELQAAMRQARTRLQQAVRSALAQRVEGYELSTTCGDLTWQDADGDWHSAGEGYSQSVVASPVVMAGMFPSASLEQVEAAVAEVEADLTAIKDRQAIEALYRLAGREDTFCRWRQAQAAARMADILVEAMNLVAAMPARSQAACREELERLSDLHARTAEEAADYAASKRPAPAPVPAGATGY